jgi:hypothetical protein
MVFKTTHNLSTLRQRELEDQRIAEQISRQRQARLAREAAGERVNWGTEINRNPRLPRRYTDE